MLRLQSVTLWGKVPPPDVHFVLFVLRKVKCFIIIWHSYTFQVQTDFSLIFLPIAQYFDVLSVEWVRDHFAVVVNRLQSRITTSWGSWMS